MKQVKTLYFYIEDEDICKNNIKNYVAIFSDVEFEIEDETQLYLFKNNEYIGLFDLKILKMEVEEW